MFADKEEFKKEYLAQCEEAGTDFAETGPHERYAVLVALLRERLGKVWAGTNKSYSGPDNKQIYYFSLEFLIGKLLSYYLLNLGVRDLVREGLSDLGVDLDALCDLEAEAGLGNGGLGRLAACFLDSMAFLGIAGHGNGIRYRYGLFQQKIVDGFQVELPDNWLRHDYPWETRKPDKSVVVRYKGDVVTRWDDDGKMYYERENCESILAVPYDIPVVSYGPDAKINTLRLWNAEPVADDFDLASFNRGDYSKANRARSEAEAVSYILYPEDSNESGRELRLKQEYFFVAAGLTSIVRRYRKIYGPDWQNFTTHVAVHINDTHPALCVPELMRIFLDEEKLSWDEAWNITVNTISYTNHTVLPEALEKWPLEMFRTLLPRIYMIVQEIDRRHRLEVEIRFPGMANEAVIQDGYVLMANLAVIGSHSVNGVARLHTKILREHVLKQFNVIFPFKFSNKTNGVSHRRFLLEANPALAALITKTIGDKWITNPGELTRLAERENDADFLAELNEVKYRNKQRLAEFIRASSGFTVDPRSLFDIQVKRIHAYKRQLLNIFKIVHLYNRLKNNPNMDLTSHTFLFAGKAAPGYYYAKQVIKLVNTAAEKINADKDVKGRIRIVFLENFSVSGAQLIYPAADVSEQISTAGKEASGTGNMKFMMNGALTLGTLDGANVEIREAAGAGNTFIFGLNAGQVMDFYTKGGYSAWEIYHSQPQIKRVTDQLIDGTFDDEGADFRVIYDSLLRDNDEYFVLKDFAPYVEAARNLGRLFRDRETWSRIALRNIAQSGVFSSDRTIREYAEDVWRVPIPLGQERGD
ncbi:MAG: glycogen/starch/alpha-glucan phosphorylase [Gracilibacteraceae bacterium]|jgi:starch phosphorylase|nr:glycogen/starch/alpha-glucan phosphorylase [Gracilibacteraceae bacterium]